MSFWLEVGVFVGPEVGTMAWETSEGPTGRMPGGRKKGDVVWLCMDREGMATREERGGASSACVCACLARRSWPLGEASHEELPGLRAYDGPELGPGWLARNEPVESLKMGPHWALPWAQVWGRDGS